MILVKANADSEAGVMPAEGTEIEIRQMYELEDFTPNEAIERFREMGVGGVAEKK